jgi:hypothetical protein
MNVCKLSACLFLTFFILLPFAHHQYIAFVAPVTSPIDRGIYPHVISSTHVDTHPHTILSTSTPGFVAPYQPPSILPTLKIYIYDLPERFNRRQRIENPKCDQTMFAAEVALHQYMLHSQVRTLDPSQADLFFVPVYSTCKWSKWAHGPDPWTGREIMSEAILYIKGAFPFMNRKGGRDHFVAATHDFGQCYDYRRSATERQGKYQRLQYSNSGPLAELHNIIVLSTFGSYSSPCYNMNKDVVIPPFIPVPPAKIDLGDTRPLKASWKKDLRKKNTGTAVNGLQTLLPVEKDIKVFFLGQLVWKDQDGNVDYSYSNGLRAKIKTFYDKNVVRRKSWWHKATPHDPYFDVGSVERDGTNGLSREEYMARVRRAIFCLAPAGFAPWSRRLYEVMIEGCIPIIIADQIVLPFEHQLKWNEFSITVPESIVRQGKLKEALAKIHPNRILQLQKALLSVKESIVFRFPTSKPTPVIPRPRMYPTYKDNAWSFILRELASKAMSWSGIER